MPKLAIVPKQQQSEPEISSRSYDHIQPGEYTGFCRSVKTYFDSHWRRWVCQSQWDIVDDSRMNTLAQITKFGIPGTDMPGHEYLPDQDVASISLWLSENIRQPMNKQ